MTQRQRAYKQALIKQVHISSLYMDVYRHDRELYEQMLQNSFGKTSSKDLSIEELISLVDFLKGNIKEIKTSASNNQIAFLKNEWKRVSMLKDTYSLKAFLNKNFGWGIDALEELSAAQFKKAIGAVKNIKPLTYANNVNYKGRI